LVGKFPKLTYIGASKKRQLAAFLTIKSVFIILQLSINFKVVVTFWPAGTCHTYTQDNRITESNIAKLLSVILLSIH